MTVKEIRKISGLSQAGFSRKYGIPLRTIEDWEGDKHQCPDYVRQLLERCVREDAGEGK